MDRDTRRANREFDLALTALQPQVQQSTDFAGKLYAALCNVTWEHAKEPGLEFSCSWRAAGAIVSDLVEGRGCGDYLDFYTSALRNSAPEEGWVAPEVEEALAKLGWVVKQEHAK